MSHELFYTSVPRGLQPGSKGFCTVALTRGMPAILTERLESLSGYRPLFPAGNPQASRNPVSWAHWRVATGGQTYSVLSRVCFAGLDYTQRSNKFAHHIALTAAEQPAGGPAWLMSQPGVLEEAWAGEPIEYDSGRELPDGNCGPECCHAWAAAAGDAGWAGVLAEAFLTDPSKPTYVIYPPGLDMLPLIAEALALIPEHQRWQVTFNTYFTDLPAGLTCAWRCCAEGSPAAQEARRAGGLRIDLTGQLAAAPDSEFVEVARTGAIAQAAADVVSFQPAAMRMMGDAGEYDPNPLQDSFSINTDDEGAVAGRAHTRNPQAVLASMDPSTTIPLKPEAADAGWLPPSGTTFSRARRGDAEVRGKRAGVLFWLFAAVWPLAVGGFIFGVVGRHPREEAVASIKDLQAELATMRARAEESEGVVKQFVQQMDGLQNEKKRSADDLAELKRKYDDLQEELSKATPAPAPDMSGPPRPLPTEEAGARPPTTIPVISLNPPAPLMKQLHRSDYFYVKLDEQNFGKGPQNVPLGSLPADRLGTPRLRLKRFENALLQIATKSDSLVVNRAKGGIGGEVELCSFSLANGELRFNWPIVPKPEDDTLRRAVLQSDVLEVYDEKTGARASIQFVEPEFIHFSMKDAAAPNLADPPKPGMARHVELMGIERPWISTALANYFKLNNTDKSEVSFEFRLDKERVTSTWRDNAGKEQTKLASLEGELQRLEGELQQLKDKPKEKNKEKEHADAVTEAQRKCDEKKSEIRNARDIVKRFNAIKPFIALVELENGVVLSLITVEVGEN